MKLIEKEINLKKKDFIKQDLGERVGLEGIGILVDGFYNNKYTDGNYIYDIKVFTKGAVEGIRTDIDDYCVISDSYCVVAIPMLQGDHASSEAKKAMSEWLNSIDFMRGEGTMEDLTRLKEIIKEYDFKEIDFEYLEKKGISTDRDKIKWELRPLAINLVTGREAHTIVGLVSVKGGHVVKTLKERKMPKELWAKVKPYMDYFKERNDNFDPMAEVDYGTYYTFKNEKVAEILENFSR